MQFDEILSRLEVKRWNRSGESAQCKCPAHEDNNASLTVSVGDHNNVVLHCHAHCSTESVLGAIGLTLNDLYFDNGNSGSKPKWMTFLENNAKSKNKSVVKVYDYFDVATGNYAFSNVRYDPKDFRQGYIDESGFWHFGYRTGADGKKLSRKDQPAAVYSSGMNAVKDAAIAGGRVFICEGEKDVDTMTRLGYLAVTCGSGSIWDDRFSEFLTGADVVILRDNDKTGADMAAQATKSLQKFVHTVRTVVPTPDINKGDVSDYFAAGHTRAEFEEMLNQDVNTTRVQPSATPDPDDLDRFMDGQQVLADAIYHDILETENLFVMGGFLYVYRGGVYKLDFGNVRTLGMIGRRIPPEHRRSNVKKRILELFYQDEDLALEFSDCNRYPSHWINFKNGMYDPIEHCMIDHSPDFRSLNQIPHEYNPNATLPGEAVEEFLNFIVPEWDDREMLLQYSGYCLTRDTKQQKFLMLTGEGGSGKSTTIDLIQNAVGEGNTSNITLMDLTGKSRFSSYGLMGKLLNSCADLEINALEDTSVLKKAIGEDKIKGEAKGKQEFYFRNYAKMLYSTNEIPVVKAERSNGFYRRLLILTMNRTPEKKNPHLGELLQKQVGYFIMLSVAALERMYQHGTITESIASINSVNQTRDDSDSVEAWLNAETTRNRDAREARSTLYDSYTDYCTEWGRTALSKMSFFKAMRVKGFGECKVHGYDMFKGVKLGRESTLEQGEESTHGIPEGGTGFYQLSDETEVPW